MGLGCMNRGTEERSRDCVHRSTAGLAGGAGQGVGGTRPERWAETRQPHVS